MFYFLNTLMMSEEEARINADDSTNQIIQFVKYARMANVYKERYDYIYCMLLKIVLLNFEKFKIREKLIELLRFQNEVTCTSDMGFVNIGLAYWEQGTKLSFFGNVQKGKKNILNTASVYCTFAHFLRILADTIGAWRPYNPAEMTILSRQFKKNIQ